MQAAFHGAHLAAKPPGGLLLGQPLDVAEHHRAAIVRRQAGDLGVDGGAEVGLLTRVERQRRVNRVETVKVPDRERLPRRPLASPAGHPNAHSVEPAAERIVGPQVHCVGLAGKHEKNSLEDIVGRMAVARHPAADSQHHRPVAVHQDGKRRLRRGIAPTPREPGQQLCVGHRPDRPCLKEN